MKTKKIKIIKFYLFITLFGSLFILSCTDYVESLGGNWIYDADNKEHPFIMMNGSKEGDPFIPCNVIAHEHNKQFAIVAQTPDTDCEWNHIDTKIANAANQTGNAVNYWIIDIEEAGRLIGPMSYDEYLKKREELGVPDKLKLAVKT
jgi:hypothetical protein